MAGGGDVIDETKCVYRVLKWCTTSTPIDFLAKAQLLDSDDKNLET